MTTDTSKKIIEYISHKKQATAKELVDYLGFSYVAVFNQLKKLRQKNLITKIGRPPKVFYSLLPQKYEKCWVPIDPKAEKIIQEQFLFITPLGDIKEGIEGFQEWCDLRNLPIQKTALEYAKTFKKYHALKKKGLINGLPKAKKTFDQVSLSQLFYLDFYSIERFGKTKLGQQLLYAKQSQSKLFIGQLIDFIKPNIESLIDRYNIEAVCFVPPTVKREIQLMKELQRRLRLKVPAIKITKVKTQIPIPQKTLNKLGDRIQNARRTFVVEEKRKYKSILIIDDAVGSGATINEIGQQILDKKLAKKVIGLAITGSFKGFEVISEV